MPKKVRKFKNPITGNTRTVTKYGNPRKSGSKRVEIKDKSGNTVKVKGRGPGTLYESGGAKPIPKSMKVRGRRMGSPNVSSKKNGGYSYKDFLDL